jgi:hypothetical protein
MQPWNLAAGDPLSLTLAADARLSETNYADDQIWELVLGGGEPAALAVQTTYGLRAHWMRLFPRFVRSETGKGEVARIDPAAFHTSPRITSFAPNSLAVTFSPFEGLEVLAEYRVADSALVMGRLRLTNRSILPQALRLEWVALLNPIDRQGGMVTTQAGPSPVLEGETSYLHPVVYMTGGPRAVSGPYPALVHDLDLYPGNTRQFSWACAGLRSLQESLDAARMATARPWEAEQVRVEMTNLSQVIEIETGDPDWDAAFALAQKTAFELLMKNSEVLPSPSFVLNRRPDQGFSVRGDGSDHPYLWSGQSALDAYYLASLLPGAPDLAAGLVRNFLAVQEESGSIDWKPGLGGQRSRRMAQPVLAALAEQVGESLQQVEWYREVFPGLLRFFDAWFLPAYDRDGDGFPEWEHPLQTGIEDSPIFDRWSPTAQGMNIQRLECPALAAMLLRECQSLIHMARVLAESEKAASAYARLTAPVEAAEGVQSPVADPAAGQASGLPASSPRPSTPRLSGAADALPALCEREKALRVALQSTWDEDGKIYHYRDFSTHTSPTGAVLAEFNGSGKAAARKRFKEPRRLVVQLKVREERTYAITFTVHGFTATGEESETLGPHAFSWMGTQARATTEHTFAAIKRFELQGLGEEDQVRVLTADYTQEDCSLFLPLWAGAPDPDQARTLVEGSLLPRYLQEYGIPLCAPDALLQDSLPGLHSATSSALLPWNQLIGEGLLRYGYRDQAADLVTRLMKAIVPTLKEQRAFRQYYHAETGQAAGERGHLHGLAPLGLFLQTLGIRRLAPKEILLDGFNPFSRVIHVKYRMIEITCHPDKTEVRFPGGQSITIDQPGPCRITLE